MQQPPGRVQLPRVTACLLEVYGGTRDRLGSSPLVTPLLKALFMERLLTGGIKPVTRVPALMQQSPSCCDGWRLLPGLQ